jgi:hypothetical protein
VFIVRPDRRDLYEALTTALGHEVEVEVRFDRRGDPDRRQREAAAGPDRRHVERRRRPELDAELLERGWTLLRVPPASREARPDPFPADTGFRGRRGAD